MDHPPVIADQVSCIHSSGCDDGCVARSAEASSSPATEASRLPSATQTYLRSQGLTDPATWTAFRIGQVDRALLGRAGLLGHRQPRSLGFAIPTFDPRTPDHPYGLIWTVQDINRHAFRGTPQGLGGRRDLGDQPRIVLTDGVMLALRLDQAGVMGVALVEDLRVLAPLRDWLAGKVLVIASFKTPRLAVLQAAVTALGLTATTALFQTELDHSTEAALAAVGLRRAAVAVPRAPVPPITATVVQDLVAEAQVRRRRGEGAQDLAAWGMADPTFMDAFGIGYLPMDIRTQLSLQRRAPWVGVRIGHTLVVPVLDAGGAVIDAYLMRNSTASIASVSGAREGMIAPTLVRGQVRVVVVASLVRAVRTWTAGIRNLAFLRSTAHAASLAAQLVAGGVQQVELRIREDVTACAAAFSAAGLAVFLGPAGRKVSTDDMHASSQVEGLSDEVRGFLARQQAGDPATWSAFRMGQVDAATILRLWPGGRRRVAQAGLLVPTFDPREPMVIRGLLRLMISQHGAGCVGEPCGIAGPSELATAPRVVLVDSLLLGLRLHQAGVRGVAVVQDPAVLAALRAWWSSRTVVIASTAAPRAEALAAALAAAGGHPHAVHQAVLHAVPERSSPSALALLGLGRTSSSVVQDAPAAKRVSAVPAVMSAVVSDSTVVMPVLPAPSSVSVVPAAVPPAACIAETGMPDGLDHHFLRYLHGYAVQCLADDHAEPSALRRLGITAGDVVRVYGIGYLSTNYLTAMPEERRAMLATILPPGAVVVPAYDMQGAVCDLLAIVPGTEGMTRESLLSSPLGLLAPAVATAYTAVTVVTSFTEVITSWEQGIRSVICLRGATDARALSAQANQMSESGVRTAVIGQGTAPIAVAAIHAALEAVGIAVTDECDEIVLVDEAATEAVTADAMTIAAATVDLTNELPPEGHPGDDHAANDLHLISVDAQTRVATCVAGARTYVIELPWSDRWRVQVEVSSGGRRHRETIDLPIAAQRERFASTAAGCLSCPAMEIATELAAAVPLLRDLAGRLSVGALPMVGDVQSASMVLPSPMVSSRPSTGAIRVRPPSIDPPSLAPTPACATVSMAPLMTAATQVAARELAAAPDVFDRLITDLGTLGWEGEDDAKRLLILAALSRKLERPVWAQLTAGDQGWASPALDLLAAITPPEDVVHVSVLTDHALLYATGDALRHRLIVIDDLAAVPDQAATSLVLLGAHGVLRIPHVHRDPISGQHRTTFAQVRGPIAVLAGGQANVTARSRRRRPTSEALAARCTVVEADESERHLAALLAAERCHAALIAAPAVAVRTELERRWHDLQRLLAPLPVVVPFAERIRLSGTVTGQRAEQELLLGLLRAHALLHQHQRGRIDGAVVASEADFRVAAAVVDARHRADGSGLGARAGQALQALQQAGADATDMRQLSALLPTWTRHALRQAIDDLVAAEALAPGRTGQGALRSYRLTGWPAGGAVAESGRCVLVPVPSAAPAKMAAVWPPSPIVRTAAGGWMLWIPTPSSSARGSDGKLVKLGDFDFTKFTHVADTG